MVADANVKIEEVIQGVGPLKTGELVTYASFILSKVREMALDKAQNTSVNWTDNFFSTSPTLPLLRKLVLEKKLNGGVIDYEIALEAGLAGDVVATVEKLVMESLNRILIRGRGASTNLELAGQDGDDVDQEQNMPSEGRVS